LDEKRSLAFIIADGDQCWLESGPQEFFVPHGDRRSFSVNDEETSNKLQEPRQGEEESSTDGFVAQPSS
jgi:hypothetical protein